MTRKKYYICITPFFPEQGAMYGAYVFDQVKTIEKNSDFKTIVFKPGAVDYEIDGVKVFGFKTKEMPSYIFAGLLDGHNAKNFIKRIKDLNINLSDVAFIHCHTSHFAVYGLALKKNNPGIKVLLQHHDLDPLAIRNGIFASCWVNTRFRAHSARKLINQVDLNICISKPVEDSLLYFPKARPAEVDDAYLHVLKNVRGMSHCCPKATYILYNGVDTNLFKPISHQLSAIKNINFRIGCIGNFHKLKDQITLIKAFELVVKSLKQRGEFKENIKLSLIGSGETKESCVKYLDEHNLLKYVEWPEWMTHDKLPNYYRSLNLFVLPSVFEGFGCVYTEAYACGVPFIGVYNQGAAEIIAHDERDNWLIEPHDYRQLAKLIEKQYSEHNEQKLCKPYDINILIKDYLEYIEKL